MVARRVFAATGDGLGVRPQRIGLTSLCGGNHQPLTAVRAESPVRTNRAGERGRPLADFRVVEIGGWWAGPIIGRILGLLGADVVKVESPRHPDPWRFHLCDEAAAPVYESSPLFLSANVGKRSLGLDIARPEGREVLDVLLSSADVLVQNLSPRAARGLRLTVPRSDGQFPALVRTSISGFGQTGPWCEYLSFAVIGDAAAGIVDGLRYADDSDPLFQGSITGDSVAGYHGAFLTLAAVYARRHHEGRGQDVDVAQVEALLNFSLESFVDLERAARARVVGNRHRDYSPFGVLRAVDEAGDLAISGVTDSSHLSSTNVQGPEAADAPKATIDERLQLRGIAAAYVLSPPQLLADPTFRARQTHATLEHPTVGRLPYVGLGARAIDHAFVPTHRAPSFGEHTDEILDEIGISVTGRSALAEQHVVSTTPLGKAPKVGG
jgi:crotonobetainyl-CoA:carnitine CoA-transferase CaiB-like acyl-CoA transferase